MSGEKVRIRIDKNAVDAIRYMGSKRQKQFLKNLFNIVDEFHKK